MPALAHAPHCTPHLRLVPAGSAPPAACVAELLARARDEERQGHRAAARATLEQVFHTLGHADAAREHAASVARWIARSYQADGDSDAALDCLELALAIAEAWGDGSAAGHAINGQAIVHWQTGRLDGAERLYLLARTRALREGDAMLAAMTAQNLGVIAQARGDYDVAQRHYEMSLAEYRVLGHTHYIVVTLNNLGRLHTVRGDWDAAE